MATRTFTKEFMLDTLEDGSNVVRDKISGKSRWSIDHEMIFRDEDGKLYRAHYRVGATESQDESPWEHEKEVSAAEVKEVDVVVKDYVPL